MVHARIGIAAAVAATGAVVLGTAAVAGGGGGFRETLTGYEEVPAVSSPAVGEFRARIEGDRIAYRLRYAGLEGAVQQAHIHLGQRHVNGGVSAFLCSNLPAPPPGTQACPPAPATITGVIEPGDVVGPAPQGIAAGEFGELVRAMKAGVTYANVHSSTFPAGEIRAQLERGGGRGW